MYGALRGHLLAKLVDLFKIWDCSQETVCQVAGIQMLSPVNTHVSTDIYSLVSVQLREDA